VSTGPHLVSKTFDGGVEVIACGRWTAESAADLDREFEAIISQLDPGATLRLRMGRVHAFDTYGALILNMVRRKVATCGGAFELPDLPRRYSDLAHKARANDTATPLIPKKSTWAGVLDSVRCQLMEAARDGANLLNLLGAVSVAFGTAIVRPSTLRLTAMIHQIDRVAWQAAPIVVLITLLIGGIIAQQGFFHFRKFGADQYVVDMVGILVLREIGVLLVAIMVAGRSGSSYTAELGSMKMREEIDALQTMGVNPVVVLILPRIIALVIALPALTFLGMMAALYGGGFVAWIYGDMSPSIFIARLHDAISVTHFKVGMIKAPFMALVIGIVSCAEGLKVRGSAESLGLRTTASVVKSIFFVIVLDGMFAMYFAAIGM
jgi:phospholipid/cholesterol/gamma-HCH transport system permease protein